MEGLNSSIIYLIDGKNFCKCHGEPPTSTIKKKRNNQKKKKGVVGLD
jgi:hypothetical protein